MTNPQRNKAYQSQKNWLVLINLLVTLSILVSVLTFGLSDLFWKWSLAICENRYGALLNYFIFFSLYSLIFTLPLSMYSSFFLEHQYQLSNQSALGWWKEWVKKQALSLVIVIPLVYALYALIWHFTSSWWLLAWLGFTGFSLLMGKLFPVFIVPLFYTYSPIKDESLLARIRALADRFGFQIDHISSLNFSKTTKKANAMFSGMGKTKRVVLADTLLNEFTTAEIEVVLAHELGHCKHNDIWKQFALGSVLSLIGFWLVGQITLASSSAFGFGGPSDVRSFPLICLVFFVFQLLTGPLTNAFSRHAETQADHFALKATQDRDSFVSSMQKLSKTNLADPNPHPALEFLLYDHPSIGKRIQMGKTIPI